MVVFNLQEVYMKKILLTLFILIFGLQVLASDNEDALKFFNSFVSASNNYSSTLLGLYSPNAKIIRQVVKPDGKTANANFTMSAYKKQMLLSSKLAKLRNYKNNYSNIEVAKVANGYKISALRQPSGNTYKLKTAMIVQKQPNGKWLIVEEMMQTKEQIFLKYVK